MHILGKILAFLTICGAVAATVLSAQFLQIRNAWMSRMDQKRTAYEKTVPELEKARKDLRDRQLEYQQLIHGWGPVIGLDVETSVSGPGQLALNIGQTAGLQQNQQVHIFVPGAGGQSTYFGPFLITAVEPQRSIASAGWPLRDSDRATWPGPFTPGRGCRVYGSAPTAAMEHLIQGSQLLLRKEELLKATQNLRTVQENEIRVATEQRNQRALELNGDPALAADKNILPQSAWDGLVRALEDEDEARNVTLAEVDALRHELRALFDDVIRLQNENVQLTRSLPEGEATEPSSVTAVSP